ncbi:LysR family transcriptional regulator [Cellulomonas triticagri]|uniref:LysR family transcriptional regulator n=1 Tax=Cellulomonas triticagri TaxID=2483352 RepID=A0A3M2JRW4_9CELL|nr:LysR family transcriptional regulator [Cellulomonas triticagri]RMI14413.1 LysR family transcriptional regulator [Cellulomonas triticagri]
MPEPVLPSRRVPMGALEVLDAVHAAGSLSGAARALGLAQPSVSTALRRLERQTGLALVVRAPSGTRLTDAGLTLLDRAREVLSASDALEREVLALRTASGARVRVAASLSIAEYLVPGWLASRPADAPLVDLTVANSRDVMAAVLDGRADLGFVEGPDVADGLHARAVAEDELVVVVAPGHPWARRRRPLTAAELASAPLAVREAGSGTRAVLDRALAAAGHPVAGSPAQLGSTSAVKNVVRAGTTAAVLSRLTVADEVARGDLRQVPVADVDLRRTLRVVWSRSRRPTPGARALAEHVLRESGAPSGR